MEPLKQALEAYNVNTLSEIAATLGIELDKPARKASLVNELSRQIPEFAGNASFIHNLGEPEQEVLRHMIRLKRVCTHRDVIIPLIKKGMVYIPDIKATTHQRDIHAILLSLLRQGLIVNQAELISSTDRRQFDSFYHFAIPPEVQNKLKLHLEPGPEVSLSDDGIDTTQPEIIDTGKPEAFIRSLFFAWAELRRSPARLLKSGDMGKRDRHRIAASLSWQNEDDFRIRLIFEILKVLNLIHLEDKQITAVDNAAVKLFWSASPVAQMRELLRAYAQLDSELYVESRTISSMTYYGGMQTRLDAEIRAILADALNLIAHVSWIPNPLFFALVSGGVPGQLVLTADSLKYLISNIRWMGINRISEWQGDLSLVEQELFLNAIKELLALGFIDIGVGPEQKLKSGKIRLSSMLRAHLKQEPWEDPPEQGQVILQPDAQLLAMGPVPLRVLANLERVAAREKHDLGVITYRVTREAAYQALQRGESLTDIRSYLEEATGQPLPQNIQRSLEEWSDLHERIIVRREVQIVQVTSTELMEKLLQDAVIRRILHPLNDITAWLKRKDTAALEKRLHLLEMLPAHSFAGEIDLSNSLGWDGDELVSRSPLPSFYVTGKITLIAKQVVNAGSSPRWQLTTQSIRQAVTNGLPIKEILNLLENMTGAPLPPAWDKTLKAWGKYFGDGYTALVRVVHLESEQVLQELRESDRDLRKWLQPLTESGSLAVVKQ
ncbi:MAG: helicase-associated domain-containing protein, partial [Anaerolineae bacterium]|nr:helicase-associated domain-containing protein [Anaerolineae bacterium]